MAERWTENHPGRDPEVLGRYTLGQLPADERSAIDAHLRECAECRQTLEEEMRLAAGVRRMARSQMKERLASRLSATRTSAVPWPRIAAVAATLMIVAGVSVIALWLQQREPGTGSTAPTAGSGPSYATETKKDRSEAPTPPPAGKGERLPDFASSAREKGSGGKDLAKAEEPRSNLPHEKGTRTLDALKESENTLQAAAPATDAARAARNEELWTEGVVSEEPMAATGAVRHDEMDKARPGVSEMQTNASRKSAPKSITLCQQVVLSQQPSSFLHGQQQSMRQQGKRKAIPTLAQQVGEQLLLTLYPDTLFPAVDLQQATVHRLGDDSLLIQVGSQLIRYRLPSSLLQQKTAR